MNNNFKIRNLQSELDYSYLELKRKDSQFWDIMGSWWKRYVFGSRVKGLLSDMDDLQKRIDSYESYIDTLIKDMEV